MTKKMNRIAAKGWAEERERKQREEAEAAQIKDDLEALRRLRSHLLNNRRGEPTDILRAAIDDYAGFITGDRQVLWAGDARAVQSSRKAP